jgi:prolipoprotein diacylglyceryltransferase
MTAPAVAGSVLADIPSPSTGVLEIGPLSIHAYGLMIALGVVAAVWLRSASAPART